MRTKVYWNSEGPSGPYSMGFSTLGPRSFLTMDHLTLKSNKTKTYKQNNLEQHKAACKEDV